MGEVTRFVNGGLENIPQQEITVGEGTIVTYRLSEHEFETLGHNNNYSNYLSICLFCLGLAIPLLCDVLSWSEPTYTWLFITKLCILSAAFITIIIYAIEYYKRRKTATTTYQRLKKTAIQLTEIATMQ